MNFFKRNLNPNKPYEDFFKTINADSIALNIVEQDTLTDSITMTIAQFYQFREDLIKAMFCYNSEATKHLMKSHDLNSLTDTHYGFYWFKGVFEDAYNTKIYIKSH